jgi:UDP-N-acetylglucosamine 2-epimerase (non-hydrolysing)
MGEQLKVMTILGTRPEIIRLSRVMQSLDQCVNHVIVHTGQNYDHGLNAVFFDEMRLRRPDYSLSTDCSTVGSAYGTILIESEKVIDKEKPDAVLILGDTNSSIAALIAKRKKIPIYHMEAGNRCFDQNVPEEVNRRIIDHISDFNLVYTEHARRNLLAEGLPARRIYLTGSPMKEVLDYYAEGIDASPVLQDLGLSPGHYFVASFHREENVDNRDSLSAIIECLDRIAAAYHMPVIVSTHPRTRKRLEENKVSFDRANIRFVQPLGYFPFVKLQKNACCVISDSGTISEESAILSFPAITIRNALERPEALDSGTIILTGLAPDTVMGSISLLCNPNDKATITSIPAEYTVSDTSKRVARLITGTARLSNAWNNVIESPK